MSKSRKVTNFIEYFYKPNRFYFNKLHFNITKSYIFRFKIHQKLASLNLLLYPKNRKINIWMFNILIILLAFGCARKPRYVPVHESAVYSGELPATHSVQKGETLYSIAWRYGLDFRRLAKQNKIDKKYTIYPGQKLLLKSKMIAPTKKRVESKHAPKRTTTSVTPTARSIKKTKKVENISHKKLEKGPISWAWPTRKNKTNTLLSNAGLNKGIAIPGKLGEPVSAAASGRVVYAGEGLRGYGKLIILKHSEKYLSAYAHNERLLVEEREEVAKGQKIAAMGSSGTDSVRLYFEIRYDGKPVNPLKYLPK